MDIGNGENGISSSCLLPFQRNKTCFKEELDFFGISLDIPYQARIGRGIRN